MRKVFVILVLLLLVISFDVSAQTFEFELQDETNLYEQMYEDYGGEDLIYNSPDDVKDFTDKFGITPSDPFSYNKLFSEEGFEYLKEYLLSNFTSPLKSISVILISIIVCAICSSLTENRLQSNKALDFICVLSAVTVLILPINSLFTEVVEKINVINIFMGAFIPVFAGILIACLKSGTAAVYSSVMFFVCEGISYCCNNFVLPFINCFTALSVATGVSNSIRLDGVIKIFKKTAYIIISVAMTLFLAVLSIQSVVSSVTDNAATKTAKYFISSFVPIIGPSLSETFGSLRGCIGLLKSSVGIYAVIAIAIVILPVIIKILVFKLTLTLCSDFSEMFYIDILKNMLDSLNQALSIILAVVLCVALMFIFSLTIISVAGGSV